MSGYPIDLKPHECKDASGSQYLEETLAGGDLVG